MKKLFLNSDHDQKRCQQYRRSKLDNRPKEVKYYFLEGGRVTGKTVVEMIRQKHISEIDFSAVTQKDRDAIEQYLSKHLKSVSLTSKGATTVLSIQKIKEAA